MKKLVLVIMLILIANFLYSQIYTGISTGFAFPASKNQVIDNGLTGELLIGYSFNQKIDIGFVLGNIWFKSITDHYQSRSIRTGITYYVLNKSVKPSVGFSTGYFSNIFKDPIGNAHIENGMGIIPSAAISFDPQFKSQFLIKVECDYRKIFTAHKLDYFVFNIGVLYYFQDKK